MVGLSFGEEQPKPAVELPVQGDQRRHEYERRLRIWAELQQIGIRGVRPATLREMAIYGGAQGIWVDKRRTASISDGGVAVGLLHTKNAYPDDLDESGVLYHYPVTNRPPGRDRSEVDATKAAKKLGLPLFVITRPTPSSNVRDVYLGWVRDWHDESKLFLIEFGPEPPRPLPDPDEEEFSLTQERGGHKREVEARPNQRVFKFKVFQRYGPACCVCAMDVPEVLDAVHIREWGDGGSDHPMNGLVMCALHHRAYDNDLFAIQPEDMSLQYRNRGPDQAVLRIQFDSIQHLRKHPHPAALQWRWQHWSGKEAGAQEPNGVGQ